MFYTLYQLIYNQFFKKKEELFVKDEFNIKINVKT